MKNAGTYNVAEPVRLVGVRAHHSKIEENAKGQECCREVGSVQQE